MWSDNCECRGKIGKRLEGFFIHILLQIPFLSFHSNVKKLKLGILNSVVEYGVGKTYQTFNF